MSRITLNPGDILIWHDPDAQTYEPVAPMVVAPNGTDLWFQFAPKPWHLLTQDGVKGLTVSEAEDVLNGELEWDGPGYLFKSYDAEHDMSLPDPNLL